MREFTVNVADAAILATIALYWFTGTIGGASALYTEAVRDPLPERHYAIAQWTRHECGGQYAAIEVPDLFLEDVRSVARLLCEMAKNG